MPSKKSAPAKASKAKSVAKPAKAKAKASAKASPNKEPSKASVMKEYLNEFVADEDEFKGDEHVSGAGCAECVLAGVSSVVSQAEISVHANAKQILPSMAIALMRSIAESCESDEVDKAEMAGACCETLCESTALYGDAFDNFPRVRVTEEVEGKKGASTRQLKGNLVLHFESAKKDNVRARASLGLPQKAVTDLFKAVSEKTLGKGAGPVLLSYVEYFFFAIGVECGKSLGALTPDDMKLQVTAPLVHLASRVVCPTLNYGLREADHTKLLSKGAKFVDADKEKGRYLITQDNEADDAEDEPEADEDAEEEDEDADDEGEPEVDEDEEEEVEEEEEEEKPKKGKASKAKKGGK